MSIASMETTSLAPTSLGIHRICGPGCEHEREAEGRELFFQSQLRLLKTQHTPPPESPTPSASHPNSFVDTPLSTKVAPFNLTRVRNSISSSTRQSRASRASHPPSPVAESTMASPAAYNDQVDVFRDIEYPMMAGKIYLDHGGTTIYAKSLIEEFAAKMIGNLYGNPHSASAPAMLSGHMVDSIRLRALAFFNADPEHFDLIFTQNATASIKLVGEAFRDLGDGSSPGTFWYGYHKDAHTSIVGIRELTKGTSHCFATDDEVEDWLSNAKCAKEVTDAEALPCLFAYPGQSNMTGRRLPLSWAKKLRQSTAPLHQNAYTLLDAAALATCAQIDFSDADAAPDFTAISFYKIFGFPDLGGLIIRKNSGHILSWRKYFGGGTVNGLTVIGKPTRQKKHDTLHDNLEDGTLPFHNIIALGCAIDVHNRLYGSMKKISQHTSYLAFRLYHGMTSLRHYNGQALCVIYNDVPDRSTYGNPDTQGGTVAFNLIRANGNYIGHSFVESQANTQSIYLRSGGLCNSGGISSYLKIEPWQFMRAWSQGHRCGEAGLDTINGKPTGVVRVSLGAMSTIKDVDTFLAFLESEYVETERVLQLTRFNDLNLHWGLEPPPSSPSHDSGFGSSNGGKSQGGESSSNITTLAHSQLHSMTSTPNLKMGKPTVAFASGPSYYESRPTTARSQVDLQQYRNSAQVAPRPGSSQIVVPVDGLRIYDPDNSGRAAFITGLPPAFITRSATMSTLPGPKKKSSLMRFFKGKKGSSSKDN